MTDAFTPLRPRLVSLAYRLLGSWSEAEDAVQDAHEKWLAADVARVFSVSMVANPDELLALSRQVAAAAARPS